MGFVFPSNTQKACKIKKAHNFQQQKQENKTHTHIHTPKKTVFFYSFCVTELRKFVKKETHILLLNSE